MPQPRRAPTAGPLCVDRAGAADRVLGLVSSARHPGRSIAPGEPQQHGRLERLHRTPQAETASPPAARCRAPQRTFDPWRREYNHERPHEALNMKRPAMIYTPSARLHPRPLVKAELDPFSQVTRIEAPSPSATSSVGSSVRDVRGCTAAPAGGRAMFPSVDHDGLASGYPAPGASSRSRRPRRFQPIVSSQTVAIACGRGTPRSSRCHASHGCTRVFHPSNQRALEQGSSAAPDAPA